MHVDETLVNNNTFAKYLKEAGYTGTSFAYSLPVHSFHTRRYRVASLTTCRLYGAAIQKSLTARARPSPDLAVRLE